MTGKSYGPNDSLGALQQSTRQLLDKSLARPRAGLARFRPWLARTTGSDISDGEFRDLCAEALAWLIVYSESAVDESLGTQFSRAAVYSPLVVELLSIWQSDLGSLGPPDLPPGIDAASPADPLLLYEHYLELHDPKQRLERGVFYTPRDIARHIVEQIDIALRERFGLPDGLADTSTWSDVRRRWPRLPLPQETSEGDPFVRILDPAAGSGVFLIEVVDRIHRTMHETWQAEGLDAAEQWNRYVPAHLLPRLFAIELMPTAHVISQFAVARKLAETGYDFRAAQRFRFTIADTLLDPVLVADLTATRRPGLLNLQDPEIELECQSADDTATVLRDALLHTPFTVVLGNPPFRGVSSNPSDWIGKLLRGTGPNDQPAASYYEINGQPLGERKHWLQDDYVKFMRYAQWQIERAGAGVVGLVTNHGYLDNTTFRAMRHALTKTFQQIDVFDLHGNRKKSKLAPDGGIDEGVFEIEQGVAIGLFSRIPANGESRVTHRQVWGKRTAKTAALRAAEGVPKTTIVPQPPHFLFVPISGTSHQEYEAGFALNDVMPVNSTAVVTARDSFVVAFHEAELADRMRMFRDASVSDAEIRERFFTRGRSAKYPPGDTRGWKLAEARRRMMRDEDWTSRLRACLYRPFDRRVIFWADWMIDWPRRDVMRHLLARPNLALVARRQMPPTGPCNYFWITDTITLDGLIRSDNRGSESVFPLWLDTDADAGQANLADDFVAAIASKLGLQWEARGDSKADARFGPADVLSYIYALLNSPTYRQRYSEALRRDFPRLMIPNTRAVWTSFCEIGSQLTTLHLTEPTLPVGRTSESFEVRLETGYPKFESGKIWLGKDGPAFAASRQVWDYHVGTHQVCKKWLRDRRTFSSACLKRYEHMVAAITATLAFVDRLDTTVVEAGGWDVVFSA